MNKLSCLTRETSRNMKYENVILYVNAVFCAYANLKFCCLWV